MVLKNLSLFNFRNYSRNRFRFSPQLNLIIGPNAVGKTNLLEAVYLLADGDSFRALRNEEMIHWEKELALIEAETNGRRLKLALTKEDRKTKKQFWVDGLKKMRREFLNQFWAVIFRPEEIRIINGSPSRRRQFLDSILAPLDWQYRQAVSAYERALRRRNRLLLEISEAKAQEEELFFWNRALIKNGEIIRRAREEFLDFANQFLARSWQGRFGHLSCRYQSSPVTEERLRKRFGRDLERRTTSIGPHRDDFSILSARFGAKEKDLALWGSRGQQRLAILALKLAQLAFVEERKGEKPVLLLDDILSELDQEGQQLVGSLLNNYQTLLTSLEKVSLPVPVKVFNLGFSVKSE